MAAPSITSASKSPPATPSTPKSPGSPTKAYSPTKNSTPPAASPPKTKCGSPALAVSVGRSTPSWPTPTPSDHSTSTKPAARPLCNRFVGVHAIVDFGVDPFADVVDLVAQRLGIQLGRTVAMVGRPLSRQIQRHLREVVGDHRSGRHVDDRGHGDAFRIVRKACEIRVLQTRNLQHRVDAAGIEIESPTALVMGWPAKPNGQHAFQSKYPANDDRAVGPRAGASDDQPVPVRLHRIAVAAVGGDPGFDVLGVAGELAGLGDVGSHSSRVPQKPGSGLGLSPPRRATTLMTRACPRPSVDWPWLTAQPARKRRPQQRQRESDRSPPGTSVIFARKFTMRKRPTWAVTGTSAPTTKPIPARHSVDRPVRN